MIGSCTTNFLLHLHYIPYNYLGDKLRTPYTDLGDKLWKSYTDLGDNLWTSYTNLSDNLWTPYTDLGDNRHENFEEKVENEEKTKFFVIITMCIVILRYFYIIYVEISFHFTVPLNTYLGRQYCKKSQSRLQIH